ncbi:MAG: hypothetical protein A2271_04150 [Candidatus Moranbacteria bacterium RIFOXYA12_FULL_35_19]|nr:MAG: Septum formation initiator [Candidatus Moranbacteria bacterium GW2011_GWF2_35_39]OGI32184.1 MAG: hypothetical protein A2489_01285 [Candidatus Moranbacteria bacterium RIFOXYC12_FULL_36_13]OGI32232.1 MAG: hypothetical protein A2343_03485 [Candidatus Moranbacteria bacterium RIFOXYB12_FULL_35_8]OGI36874.1 MAG: hypothetical protein A2271_04150 [Candidatus Moranbacteria bacterium RIFOXYA12_FULL_35_19]
MKNNNSNFSWTVVLIIVSAIVVLGFLSVSIYREFSKKKQVENDINSLKEQAEKIKQENMSLEERIAYLGSQDYQKIQAKDKLDLQEPKENVVIIAQDSNFLAQEKKETEKSNSQKTENFDEKKENYLKWWEYFIN